MTDNSVAAQNLVSRAADEMRTQGSESQVRLATTRDERVRGQWELLRAIERLDEPAAEALLRWLRIGGYGDRRKLRPLEIWEGLTPEHHRAYQRNSNRTRIQRILDYVLSGDRIFDVGCGFGYVAGILLRDAGLSYYCGIDVGSHRVRATKQMIESLGFDGLQVHLETLSVFDLKPEFLTQHRPSLILMLEVLEHLHNPDEALEAVARAAPPDASILFTIPMFGRLDTCKGHHSTFDAERLIELCKSVGLIVQQVEPVYNTWTFVLASPGTAGVSQVMLRCKQNPAEMSGWMDGNIASRSSGAAPFAQPGGDFSPISFSRPVRQYESHWKYRTRRVKISHGAEGLVCDVLGGEDHDGGQYGGIKLPVESPRALRLTLTFVDPENIEAIYVAGYPTGSKQAAVQWMWKANPHQPFPATRTTCVLLPGFPSGMFQAHGDVATHRVANVHVFIRIVPGTHAGFILHRAEVPRQSDSPHGIASGASPDLKERQ